MGKIAKANHWFDIYPTKWVLVANASAAKILEYRGTTQFRLVYQVDFPRGRLKSRDIDTDKPGRSFSSSAQNVRHAFSQTQDAHEHSLEIFAHDLALFLQSGRVHNQFEKLILVAEPKMLGKICNALDEATSKRVVVTLDKDLNKIPDSELLEHLGPLVHG